MARRSTTWPMRPTSRCCSNRRIPRPHRGGARRAGPMPATITRMGTSELLAALSPRMFDEALDAQAHSFSAWLEQLSPTDPEDKSGLDAFERLLMEADIRTRSVPGAGYYASE